MTTTETLKTLATVTAFATQTSHIPTFTSYKCVTASPPSNKCKNKGHQFAEYELTNADVDQPATKWNLDSYKSRPPLFNGTSTLLGAIFRTGYYYYYSDFGEYPLPNYPNDVNTFECFNYYYNDRGYIYAPQTGEYKFHISAYSRAAFIWVGDVAIRNYNVTNALVSATADGHLYGGGPSASIFLNRGQYYPIRVAWRCIDDYEGYFKFDFYMNIVQPDGHILHGEYFRIGRPDYYAHFSDPDFVKVYSPYIVQFGCGKDAKRAPPFPDWGNEG